MTEHTDYTDCCMLADPVHMNPRMNLGVAEHVDHDSLPVIKIDNDLE